MSDPNLSAAWASCSGQSAKGKAPSCRWVTTLDLERAFEALETADCCKPAIGGMFGTQ
jgi:hypothetical protein